MYKENPKTKGSGIICAIPQTGICPNKCEDCFFQSGRSYLEPLEENLPNVPPIEYVKCWNVVRMNDGNDSSVDKKNVMESASKFQMKFYNTAIHKNIHTFDAPVVLTINPGEMTDKEYYKLNNIPDNLMFVRFRTNTWNKELCKDAVKFYTDLNVPVVLTFMAYFNENIPERYKFNDYIFRKRTLNSYWAITTKAWERVMQEFKYNMLVYSCGKIEGEKGSTLCKYCGNCLREYFSTMERINVPLKGDLK